MPAMWTELRTTYTDIQIIFFVVAALHFTTRPVLRWRDAGMAFVAMALAIAGKGTGLTLVPPVAFVLAVRLVFWIPSGRRITALAAVLGIAVTLLAIAALTLVPNWHRHQNPGGASDHRTCAGRTCTSKGSSQYADMNPEGPWRETGGGEVLGARRRRRRRAQSRLRICLSLGGHPVRTARGAGGRSSRRSCSRFDASAARHPVTSRRRTSSCSSPSPSSGCFSPTTSAGRASTRRASSCSPSRSPGPAAGRVGRVSATVSSAPPLPSPSSLSTG